MTNYNRVTVDYEKLAFLRKNTTLDPISVIKINRLRNKMEKFRMWYYKLEGDLLDIDYSITDEFEYTLRLKAWERKCIPIWNEVKTDIGLFEFSEAVMEENMYKEKTKKIKK